MSDEFVNDEAPDMGPDDEGSPDDRSKIRYLVTSSTGDFVIEIPNTWKVTFGAVNPGATKGYSGGELHCMRVYEGTKLRGVYCDVRSFRDLSIPMARKQQSETRSSTWTQDSAGNFEGSRKRQIGPTEYVRDEPDDLVFE